MHLAEGITILLTHDINRVDRAGNAVRIVLDDVGCLENSLDGAGFDIELVIAEAILSRCPMSSARYSNRQLARRKLGPRAITFPQARSSNQSQRRSRGLS